MKQIYGRVDSGFYYREAVEAYEEYNARFTISARKTSRLVEELRRAEWKPSPKTDGDAECEFRYQPDGWGKEYRFVALRYEKTRDEMTAEETEQYQLFETSQYKYRVLVTDFSEPVHLVFGFYNQRSGAENLIKEANNDAGLTAHPSGRFDVNGNHFQLAMLAYNLNCWLMLFNREPQANATELRHTTLATSRLRLVPRIGLCAGDTAGLVLKTFLARSSVAMHRILCADCKRDCASTFGAGLGGDGLFGRR